MISKRLQKRIATDVKWAIEDDHRARTRTVIGARRQYKVPHLEGTQDTGYLDGHEIEFGYGNLVSSKLKGSDRHMPALDLDLEHAYLPSSSEGHGHLYLNVALPWWKYRILLWVLAWTNIIQPGYYRWSVKRGASFLRAPGVTKDSLPDGPSKVRGGMS